MTRITNKVSLTGFLFHCDNIDTGPVAAYKKVYGDPLRLGIRGERWKQQRRRVDNSWFENKKNNKQLGRIRGYLNLDLGGPKK